jgi:hypothetical protein
MTYFHKPAKENFNWSTQCYPKAMREKIRLVMGLDERMSPVSGNPAEASEPVEYRNEGSEDSTTAHLRNFFDAIRSGGTPIEPIRFGVDAVNVGHMVNASCQSGKLVRWDAKKRKMAI